MFHEQLWIFAIQRHSVNRRLVFVLLLHDAKEFVGAEPERFPDVVILAANAHYLVSEIRRRHWLVQGQRVTLTTEEVEQMIDILTAKTEAVIEEVAAQLPRGFPEDVADKIFDGMRRQSKKLAAH